MDTEKTRIMTATNGESILPQLLQSNKKVHDSVHEAIRLWSKRQISKESTEMHEETTGLRILGSPIGSAAFCKEFHLKKVKAAMDDAETILNGLSDNKQCYESSKHARFTKLLTFLLQTYSTRHSTHSRTLGTIGRVT